MGRKIIAVIPAYNEGGRIGPVIRATRKYVQDVLVVDDHSQDNTYEVALANKAKGVRLIINMGAGFATRVGCDIAMNLGADVIMTLDADGQHDPNDIPKMVSALHEDVDIVFGSRPRSKAMPLIKRIGNFLLTMVARTLFGLNVQDSQTGFHAFKRNAYPKLRWSSARYGVVSEFIHNVAKHKLHHKEVLVRTIYTDKQQGMRKRDAVKSVFSMIWWRLRQW